MKAMILAAGRGERMRPLTDHIPKPLLEIHGKPLIIWHIEKLASLEFNEIIINIAHLGYKIPMALGDGSKWGVKLIYSNEQKEGALESAGGIIKALPLLGEGTFLVVNGDIWCDYEFDSSFDLGDDLAHLILVPNPKHNQNGDFTLDNRRVFNDGENKLTFSGIGYYSPKLFIGLTSEKKALAPILRMAIEKDRVSGSLHKSRWYDIGTPQRLNNINNDI
ncbi:nucleotidyltransferase family protein [Candidatus Sulfurimonas marisnigri]|uniref:Nucleotidyltransferase family protein n=1 Tax=Candidatus Sulfurimonas marisnigri TaxID=2740405 RepID=A0A7S7M035_9BACT|nr:nucleotidyltransferase family protein [Candidatus Sulfurimonas marisnigri]QOY54640.1 nucleotidyltransferase family protein [Candidatus Sulfurimonas marisnigri]